MTETIQKLTVEQVTVAFPPEYLEPGKATMTREQFVHSLRDIAIARLNTQGRNEQAETLQHAKLTYGAHPGVRGVCYWASWRNDREEQASDFITISATGEESRVQLAGTTLHELGHVLGRDGHGALWKAACKSIGLDAVSAAGQHYAPEHFAPEVWQAIESLPELTDGQPAFGLAGYNIKVRKTCPQSRGSRGGKSTGQGSGRMSLYHCKCEPPWKVRLADKQRQPNIRCEDCGATLEKVTEAT